jgi:signal transduction histidine kinase
VETLILAAMATLVHGVAPAWAQGVPAGPMGGGYFVYGLILFCGLLLFFMLKQNRRTGDLTRDHHDAKRMVEVRDAVLSVNQAAALFFEPDPSVVVPRSNLRVTQPLRDLLALPAESQATGEPTLDVIQTAFDDEGATVFRERLDALRAEGHAFVAELRIGADGRSIKASGERVLGDSFANAVDLVWFEDISDAADLGGVIVKKAEGYGILETISLALPMPAWRRGADQELMCRNPAAKALMGSDDPSLVISKRAARTNTIQMESVHVVVEGDRRLFEFTESPIPDGTGTVGWAIDVTALEETQSDVARLVVAHEEVLDELSTAIAVFGPDRRLRYFNAAFSRFWRIEPEQLEDKPTVSEFLNLARERRRLPEQSDFAAFRDQWNEMFTTLIGPRQELLFLPDEMTLRMIAAPHPNGGLLLTFENVTDRLVLERSYNVLSAVQRETIDNLNDALAVFGSDGKLDLLNPRFRMLWGLPRNVADSQPHINEVLDLMKIKLAKKEDGVEFSSAFFSQMSDRKGGRGRIEHHDGLVLDYELVPLSDGATLVQYWDVTDSIHMQRAMQERTEALEQADRLKSEFIDNVSYELRTPLNAIIGFSELLGMQSIGPMNTKQIDYADSIIKSSSRLATLINDILDLSSIEAGYMELDCRDVSIPEIMSDLELLAQERARSKGIAIVVTIAPDVQIVRADPVRLKQAMFNLISNALKFTYEGGAISMAALLDGQDTVLKVTDTGVGMPDHLQSRAFESFRQGTRSGRSTGVGLGLSLVARLIQLHGGQVEIESQVGVGTTVSCRLPKRDADVAELGTIENAAS